MPGWEQLGMQAASQGISGALGLVLGNINDRRQLRQQERLQNLQIAGNKQLTDYNFMKQMEMWKNTHFPAQMAMLKAAGLNPALIYEHGGPGGSTGITQGTVTGTNAPTGGQEIMQMMGMGLTRQLQAAQIENIKAQTDATRAAIPKTQQETINLSTQNAIQEIEKAFQERSLENKLSLINMAVSKLNEEINIIENDREISDATKLSKIMAITADSINAALQPELTRAQTQNVKQSTKESLQRIKNLTQDIKTAQEQINKSTAERGKIEHDKLINFGRLSLDRLKEYHEDAKARGAYDDTPGLKELLDNILILAPTPAGKTTPIKGFHQR